MRRRYDTEAAAIILLSPHFVLAHEDRLAVDAVALVKQVGAQLLLLGVDEEERAAVGVHQVLRVHLPPQSATHHLILAIHFPKV